LGIRILEKEIAFSNDGDLFQKTGKKITKPTKRTRPLKESRGNVGEKGREYKKKRVKGPNFADMGWGRRWRVRGKKKTWQKRG